MISSVFSLPLWPIAAGLILLIYMINVFCVVYHLIRFGVGTNPKLVSLIFLVGASLLLMVSMTLLSQIDLNAIWQNFGNFNSVKLPNLPKF